MRSGQLLQSLAAVARNGGRESQARLLRGGARRAPQLLAVVRSLNESRAGRSDPSGDFRTLARWFAEAPDDDARQRLWGTVRRVDWAVAVAVALAVRRGGQGQGVWSSGASVPQASWSCLR
ncbi:DUF2397 family protein [Streptomyces virginiae]|uniref:DUF2397 family protein n=1 Tax=Streptomyces virginiae TaxID=1961 RepID=UPI00368FD890